MKALPFFHQYDRVARKASDMSQLIGRDFKRVKNCRIFSTCVVTAFLRAGLPLYHSSLHDKPKSNPNQIHTTDTAPQFL